MKKISVISVLSLAFALLYTACLDDRIYHPGGTQNASLTVKEAKTFFENNAEELHLLAFSPQYSTKSGDIGEINITPRWEKAQARYNEHLSIVEVPLKTNVLSVAFRSHVIPGICQIDDSGVAIKKLTVMKRPNGNPHILVMTLLPDCGETSKIRETLENFNYMESHNFSGLILFSTTDGTFVEGYKYYKGKQQHAVKVTPVSEAADIISGEEPYDMLRMANMSAGGEDDSIYDDAENTGNMICDYCNGNGCPECANPNCTNCFGAGCTHCNTVNLGDVTVTPDPDPEPWYPGTGIDVTPDDRCPLCGYITCKGNCQDKENPPGTDIPPTINDDQETENTCPKCFKPLSKCNCPIELPANEIATENSKKTNQIWDLLNQAGIDTAFLNKHWNADVEWSAILTKDSTGNYQLTKIHTDGQSGNVSIRYDDQTIATIHNHPSGSSFSLTDIFSLINMNENTKGNMQHYFLTPNQKTQIHCLYIYDADKASLFRSQYSNSQETLTNERKEVLTWFKENGTGCTQTEYRAYSIAWILDSKDSGIAILRSNPDKKGFKQMFTFVQHKCDTIQDIKYGIYK